MKISHTIVVAILAGAAFTARGADAKTNWGEHCSKCHGDDGIGNTKQGKKLSIASLADPKVQAKFTDEDAFKSMKEGIKDDKGKTRMKPIEGLSDAEMKELVPFVRALKK
ncbi:MAG: c-type cytochrome [Verrucomicrobia bacterium]|nr:c-type cytochrome [Verrucomicrobiota bacterium]